MRYAELHCRSNFSFLRGASHPEELVRQAAEFGHAALAITDRNSLAGVVRAHRAARQYGLHLVIGAEITPVDAPPLVLLATNRAGYGRLARLITRGRRQAVKGACALGLADVAELGAGLIAIAPTASAVDATPPDSSLPRARGPWRVYREVFGRDLYLAAELMYDGPDDARLAQLARRSKDLGIPLVAANDVHYHVPDRRYLQDVLTCIRARCRLTEAGRRLFANAQRHLRPLVEIERRYAGYPAAVERSAEIAARCQFRLDELRYEYPHELCPDGKSAPAYLAELVWAGARERYPAGVPENVRQRLETELALIAELKYEHYFLTVWDLVRLARRRGILCQGRGSAANSAACYCLGITAVDPARIDLLFERFISRERNEPPDIDIDFEHERREEVFQYIYQKYGRERAALTAEVITYRPRSAVRDVGKVLGLSLDRVDLLAKSLDWWSDEAVPEDALRAAGLEAGDRTAQMLVRLVRQLLGFPRHLSQHVGGFVITESPLCEIVPLENGALPDRTFIEWDKDDIDALGILKVDCLSLGMLTAINKCFALLAQPRGTKGQRDVGTKVRKENRAGDQEDVSRIDRLAEGDRAGQVHLCTDTTTSGDGATWPDGVDASCGGGGGEQHRRGQRAREPAGRPALSGDVARFPRGAGDPTDHREQVEHAAGGGSDCAAPARDESYSAGSHPKSTDERGYVRHAGVAPTIQPSTRFSSSLRPCVPASLLDIPPEDPAVYDMICAADTVGVFQIESRAQMSMLPRLRPRHFYDLVIEVAIVRPGPIQGGMVHPYLRRRCGTEPVVYPSEAVRQVLEKTLGVPLFQEQVMRLAVVAANFTPGEADQLRRSMAAWRHSSSLDSFRLKLVRGMLANGYSRQFAEQIYQQIRGFGEYGFPESHAASFALLVYASAWLKRYYPAAFCAALLNSQPLGFYTPGQLVRDARAHGVTILPVDVNASDWDCGLENGCLRLGFRVIRGLGEEKARAVVAAREASAVRSIGQLSRKPGVSRSTLLRLAAADAFRSLGLGRREALWQILALDDAEPPLFADQEPEEPQTSLPVPAPDETVVQDYDAIGFSLTGHPIGLVRRELAALQVTPHERLRGKRHGQPVQVAGLVTVRQRPGTAKGMVFITLEDETGNANLVVHPSVWERDRHTALGKIALLADGHLQRQGEVIHIVVRRLHDLSTRLVSLRHRSRDFR